MNSRTDPKHRTPTSPRLAAFGAALAALTLAQISAPATALATSYGGWGDTGWNHYDKRECCEDAVWLAQEDGILSCEAAGGSAKVRSGTTRGVCDWDARGSGRDRVYRCTAKADVYCR